MAEDVNSASVESTRRKEDPDVVTVCRLESARRRKVRK